MKKLVQSILQRLLGFRRYLFVFAKFKIRTLKRDRREGDFFHFLTLLPRDGHVLDIGANLGIMTVWMARRCESGKVYSFEPMPENFAILERIVAEYKLQNVSTYQLALGDSNENLTMVMPEVSKVRMQGLSHVKHESITDFNDGKEFVVEQKRLDDLQEIRAHKIAGIKIDVENFEQFVFMGASDLLAKDRPVVYCELWENDNRDRCFMIFRELGYSIQVLEEGGLVEWQWDKHSQQNFFFIP